MRQPNATRLSEPSSLLLLHRRARIKYITDTESTDSLSSGSTNSIAFFSLCSWCPVLIFVFILSSFLFPCSFNSSLYHHPIVFHFMQDVYIRGLDKIKLTHIFSFGSFLICIFLFIHSFSFPFFPFDIC